MKCFVSGSQLFNSEGIRLGFAFVKNSLHVCEKPGIWFGLFTQTRKY